MMMTPDERSESWQRCEELRRCLEQLLVGQLPGPMKRTERTSLLKELEQLEDQLSLDLLRQERERGF